MDTKRLVGITLIALCAVGFIFWNLQPLEQTPTAIGIRSFVGGLLAGGAILSWFLLVTPSFRQAGLQ
jgi:RsiW-degrading membrane proteinase PrsW (M82 family)